MAIIEFMSTVNGSSSATALMDLASRLTAYIDDPIVLVPDSTFPNEFYGDAGTDMRLVESVQSPRNDLVVDDVSLLGADVHSSPRAFLINPLSANSGTVHSYERWLRVRFGFPFNTVQALRVWSATTASLVDGWSIKWGFTSDYATPVSSASVIAVNDLPSADPGLGGAVLLTDDLLFGASEDGYSLWLVLQVSADVSTVTTSQPYGYTAESSLPEPLKLQFAWVDT